MENRKSLNNYDVIGAKIVEKPIIPFRISNKSTTFFEYKQIGICVRPSNRKIVQAFTAKCCDCFASNFSIHIKRMPRLICLFSFESLVQQHSYTLNKCMQPLSSLSLAQRAISVAQKQWKKCKHFHRYKKSGISSVQY